MGSVANTDAIKQFRKSLEHLRGERQDYFTHWARVSQYIDPIRGRFLTTEENRGSPRHQSILDPTGTRAKSILAAGLMAGMTSPARPWFRLAVPDSALMNHAGVKTWLATVTLLMRDIFARSNMYQVLHHSYDELSTFGTFAGVMRPNYDTVIHGHALTAGEYMIATDEFGFVNTLYRELRMSVDQMVRQFGFDKCSGPVKAAYLRGAFYEKFDICQVIDPRREREPNRRDSLNMPWRSVYFESSTGEDNILHESGYRTFPVLSPRWTVIGGETYGWGPGMESLGAIERLQRAQLMKGKAEDYLSDPPVQVPESMRGKEDLLPGGTSYYDELGGPSGGIRSAFNVGIDVRVLLEDIADMRQQINQAFYADLFLMIAQLDTTRTATEIAARQEEKLIVLGPVLERLHNELLGPLIDYTFERALESGILPPPPPQLAGSELKVEYVSMLAQAQRAIGVNSVDRLLGVVGAMANFKPDVTDKLDSDRIVEGYSDMLGVDPDFIIANEQVALIRQQRDADMRRQQAIEAAPSVAGAMKTVGETDMAQVNAAVSSFSNL